MSPIQPKRLFPAAVDTEEIPFKSLENEPIPLPLLIKSDVPPLQSDSSSEMILQSEIRILQLQNNELKRNLKLAQDRDALEAEAREVLIDTQTQLFLLQDQMQELRSQRDFERLERHTLQATFDAERAAFEETVGKLKKQIDGVKGIREERDSLQEALDRLQKEKAALELKLVDSEANESKLQEFEYNQTRLLSALKKGQQVSKYLEMCECVHIKMFISLS